MSRASIYLDHNASAPLLPEAREAIVDALALCGNPSSVHAHGRALRETIEVARAQVAALAGATREQVVFTSSATEAITQAVLGGAKAFDADAVVVSDGEHQAVLKAAEASGLRVKRVKLDGAGRIDAEALADIVRRADSVGMRLLVAVHLVNNETGVVQPLERIEALVGPTTHVLFVDAVQAFGKRDLGFSTRATDMMAMSGHKIGGPAGVGALLVKGHADQVRLIPGGGQEQGRRGGTESAALIAGFGVAAEAFPERYRAAGAEALIARAEEGMRGIAPGLVVFGGATERIGNVSNFAIPGLKNAAAMMGLDLKGISVSSGSACSSGKVGRSHVLEAMGVSGDLAENALRVSVGWSSSTDEIAAYLETFSEVVGRHLSRRGRAA